MYNENIIKVGDEVMPEYPVSVDKVHLNYFRIYCMVDQRVNLLPAHFIYHFYWPIEEYDNKGEQSVHKNKFKGVIQRIIVLEKNGKLIKNNLKQIEKSIWSSAVENTEFIEIDTGLNLTYDIYNYNVIFNILINDKYEAWVSGFLFGKTH